MGGLWRLGWSRVAFCGWPWSHLGAPTRAAERIEPCLGHGRSGTGGAERGLRRLGTWRRPSPAVQPLRRPKSTNPFTRQQEEDWRRRNKTVLTYVAAAAVGMLGASYAAVPLYRLYCQVGPALPAGRPIGRGRGAGQIPRQRCFTVSCWRDVRDDPPKRKQALKSDLVAQAHQRS